MSGKDGKKKGEPRETRASSRQATLEAAWKENANEESEIPPSTQDMWKLMLEMNEKLSSIVADNKRLATDLKEVKEAMDFNDNKLSEMVKKLNHLTDEMERQIGSVSEMQKKIQTLQEENESNFLKLDELEQYTRKKSLEIHGVPESLGMSCEEVVKKLAEQVDVSLDSKDIDITHRLQRRKNDTKPIIVKFISHKKKHEMYLARTKLKNVKLGDILDTEEEDLVSDLNWNAKLFINENLTNYRRRLFGNALSLRKEKIIANTWSLDGKIFIKVKETDKPKLIRSENDLANLNLQQKSSQQKR